jgi:hypothetical protein
VRLFVLLIVAALALLSIWWFLRTPPEKVARTLRRALVWLGGGLLVFLAARGSLPWLFALLGAAAPFFQRFLRLLQFLPLLQRLHGTWRGARSAQGASSDQTSRVRTKFLHMELDHDSGAMSGEVIAGRFAGARLADLSPEQLLELLGETHREDAQSATVLEAYLDRELGSDWRQRRPGHGGGGADGGGGQMSLEEAYEILGLDAGASKDQVLQAHRRLMQRLHPDRGGSSYLAAKINKAKDLLLDHVEPARS